MPIYEFKCQDCNRLTSVFVKSMASSYKAVCQHCGGKKLERAVSRFAYHKSGQAILEEYFSAGLLGRFAGEGVPISWLVPWDLGPADPGGQRVAARACHDQERQSSNARPHFGQIAASLARTVSHWGQTSSYSAPQAGQVSPSKAVPHSEQIP